MNNTHGDLLYRPGTGTPTTPRPNIMDHIAPFHGEVGWICPICGRGLAPSTSYCPCNVTRNVTYLNGGTSIEGYTTTSTPPEAHFATTATSKVN